MAVRLSVCCLLPVDMMIHRLNPELRSTLARVKQILSRWGQKQQAFRLQLNRLLTND